MRVTATGDETALAGIMRPVEQAQQSKSRAQLLADKAAAWLFYLAIGVAVLTTIGWTAAVGFDMVGDGVNDAPALTRADIGIAIGGGTDVAIESTGIILVQSTPLDVVKIIELSRASYGKMVQNLIWATGYNVVALPLAAGVLAPIGILLSPAVGALFMPISTIVVACCTEIGDSTYGDTCDFTVVPDGQVSYNRIKNVKDI